jgi:cytochrome c oxidase subunit 3/cytochrome o ubiquinol oxidase subunit 3
VSEGGISLERSGGPRGTGQTFPVPPAVSPEKYLSAQQWGMLSFLGSEVAFFSTLIMTYIAYLGQDRDGPTPGQVLRLGLVSVTTLCLLTSSLTVHMAERSLRHGGEGVFRLWWSATIALGVVFLLGTAYEWYGLIYRDGLTIGRNLFGSTYYTLVGFHAFHVTGGVVVMLVVLGITLGRKLAASDHTGVQLVSWYWHFVDVVWVVVFTVVYLVGR